MTGWKTRSILIGASLLVGALSSLAVAGLRAPSETEAFELTIPVGRIGDHYELVGHRDLEGHEGGKAYNSSYDFRLVFEVEPPVVVFDEAAKPHRAIRYTQRIVFPTMPADTNESRQTLYFDLDTRESLRYDSLYNVTIPSSGSPLETVREGTTWAALGSYGWGVDALPLFQGQTFSLGESLDTAWWTTLDESQAECGQNPKLATHTWAAERGTLEGDPVMSLRTDQTTSWGTGNASQDSTMTRRVWVSGTTPYNVALQVDYASQGPDNDFTSRLVEAQTVYRPGSEPIPWGDHPRIMCHPGRNEDAARSGPDRHVPADGSGAALTIPMSRALASVESDPTLVQFADWRSKHPKATLAGGEYKKSRMGDPGVEAAYDGWQFTYANGTEAIELQSLWAPGALVPANRVVKEFQLPPEAFFTQAWRLPANPITIGYAVGLWKTMAPANLSQAGPTHLGWGIYGFLQEPVGPSNPVDYGKMLVSRTAQEHTFVLELDTHAGHLVETYESRGEHTLNFTRLVALSAVEAPATTHALRVAPLVPLPQVVVFAYSSLLVLFVLLAALRLARWIAGAWGGLPGYAKVEKGAVLDLKTRADLLRRITTEPGLSASQLWRSVGGGWSTTVYHLRVLEGNGFVSSVTKGRHKRFFAKGTADRREHSRIAVLRNERTAQAYEAILSHPGLIQRELARVLQVSFQAVAWHIKRLESEGLVRRKRAGRAVHLYAQRPAATHPAARAGDPS